MKNNQPQVLRLSLPTPLRKAFDYIAPFNLSLDSLEPGQRFFVPFQQRELIGVLLEVDVKTEVPLHRLKPVKALIDEKPVIQADILQLCLWASDYYHYPLGEVIDAALPVLLRQGAKAEFSSETYCVITEQGLSLDFNTLLKAPRQTQALQLLSHHPEGLSVKYLREQGIPSAVLNSLQEKAWLEIRKQHFLSQGTPGKEFPLKLNADQAKALEAILSLRNQFQVSLLDGVTGSGKTEVYLQAIETILSEGKQVLVLVPEIGLTPQSIERFQKRFSVPILALHSGLSDKERLNAFLSAKIGDAKIIIGTRSAVFSPFQNLGLIIVDEEHDLSFKQQEGFRYHARDLAIMRAQALNLPIVLGSATPCLETLSRALQGRYQHLCLPVRAGEANPALYSVIDIRHQKLEEGLSQALLQVMREKLEAGDQVILFLNRRGFAPVLMCHACGWSAICKRCDTRMTYHFEPKRLHCHHCDSRKPVPIQCGECGEKALQLIGLGTERLEHVLEKYFPNFPIARIDRDSTQRKGSLENWLDGIQKNHYRILIGTQMLAKGHHFPNVTLVGIVDADGGFFSADFRAIERMGQLILQVSGRAGRDLKSGKVLIQTRHPDHPLLHQLLRENYQHFAKALLNEREQAMMPPFAHLALFRAEAHSLDKAMQFLEKIKAIALSEKFPIPIWGPVPAPMQRRAGKYRVQLLFQSKLRPLLQKCLKHLLPEIEKLKSKQEIRWSLDVDPLELL